MTAAVFVAARSDSPSIIEAAVADLEEGRRTLLQSHIGLVEDLRSPGVGARKSAESLSANFQVCLPYLGLFVWHVGNDEVVGDANQVLFVAGGESYHLSQPIPGEYAELILTPDPALLAELTGGCDMRVSSHPLFLRRSRRADLSLQHQRTRFLHRALRPDWSGLAVEESVIRLLRSALESDVGNASAPGRRTRHLIGRTKEFLEANLANPIRLTDVARAVGASPAYLTDVFRRAEGVPLHRYLMQLRLARALVELRHAPDLTTLSLDLGFSSHSHFTAAFRRAFGCTPSQFRRSARNGIFEHGTEAAGVSRSAGPPGTCLTSCPSLSLRGASGTRRRSHR
jgi:AraC-like DNA-binding protein